MAEKSNLQKFEKALSVVEAKINVFEETQKSTTEQLQKIKELVLSERAEMSKEIKEMLEEFKREMMCKGAGEGSNMKSKSINPADASSSPNSPVSNTALGLSQCNSKLTHCAQSVQPIYEPNAIMNEQNINPEIRNMNTFNPHLENTHTLVHPMNNQLPTSINPSTLNPFAAPIYPHFTQNSVSIPPLPLYTTQGQIPVTMINSGHTQNHTQSWNHTDWNGPKQIPHTSNYRVPKLDFPRFEGKDPRGWINKCEKFFQLNPTTDLRAKVLCAALYMEGEADIWYRSVEEEKHNWLWPEFVIMVCHRFARGGYENIVGQFNKLTQKGNVDEYITQFDELRLNVMAQEGCHRESYYVDNFISGLKEEIAQHLYNQKPRSMQEAREMARSQEHFLSILDKKYKVSSSIGKYNNQGNACRFVDQGSKIFGDTEIDEGGSKPLAEGFKKLSVTELADKKKRGLCFYCDQKYEPGHKCIKKKLYVLLNDEENQHEHEELAYIWEGKDNVNEISEIVV